jgi:hypothetical protein
MSAQTPHALTIPEILCEVLDYLDSRTLIAACLVNKAWTDPSLNILWRSRDCDWMERLGKLPGCRRQFYADKIRFLGRDKSPIKYQHCIKTLNLPRLRTLEVFLTERNRDFNHYLVPTLEVFRLCGITTTTSQAENYLRQLPERCPDLREFCVDHCSDHIDFERLEDYLKQFSKLRNIDLYGMSDSAMTDEVIIHLASLPLLEIRMKKCITFKMIDLAYRRLVSGSLFPNVGYIDLKMEWRAAAMLVPTLTTLRELKLELPSGDSSYKVFQAIGTLTELRNLYLMTHFQIERNVSREEILAIGHLHKLRNLAISGLGALTLDDSVTNDDLVSFLSSFPDAEKIAILIFQTSLITSSAMIALATTSKRLRYCGFRATLDLGFVDSSDLSLFPNLDNLSIRRLHYPDIPTEG